MRLSVSAGSLAVAGIGPQGAASLADALRLPGNGGDSSDKRRDKHSQQEAVRAAGARAIKQALCTSLEDVSAFLDTFGDAPIDVILKPTESAGSDGVARCRSRAEARAHFETLFGAVNVCGATNESVLAQEFISGTEYALSPRDRALSDLFPTMRESESLSLSAPSGTWSITSPRAASTTRRACGSTRNAS